MSMVRKRIFRSVFGAALAVFSLGVISPEARSESLFDAVGMAVGSHPDLEAAKANKRSQDYELKQARGLYLPSIDLSGYVGRGRGESVTDVRTPPVRTRSQISLTATQLIFDGFDREYGIELRAARVDGAAHRVRERSEVVTLGATEAYLNVLRNQELVELARQNVGNHQATLGKVRARESAGQSGVGDVQQAYARLATAQDTLVQAEQTLAEVKANYRRNVGVEPSSLNRPVIAAADLPANVEVAVQEALSGSPTLYAGGASIDESIAAHRQAASSYYPRINLVASASYDEYVSSSSGWNRDMSVTLRMDWNLFRGGIDMYRRMAAAERIGQSRAQQASSERAVEEETRLAWAGMHTADERIKILQRQVAANAQVVSIYTQEFELGQRELLNVLDAQNELFNSRTKAVTASYVAQFSRYRVLSSMGRLSSYMKAPVPVEATADARSKAGVKTAWAPTAVTVR